MRLNKRQLWSIVVLAIGLGVSTIACEGNLAQKMLYNRARNLHDHGKIDKAIVVYLRVLEKDGDNSAVHYDLGVAYADKGDTEKAREQIVILRKLDRADLADVLNTVVRDSNSVRVRKRLQAQHDAKNE
ncbi:MAG: tetratricopeptide repeat protein [Candidatus Omnitrophica bacterium]|nr:tetratricopeptide repeat protein [Candidatus Omnitrophota bacterium]